MDKELNPLLQEGGVFANLIMNAILDNMQESITVYDQEGTLLYYNSAADKSGLVHAFSNQQQLLHADGQTPIANGEAPLQKILRGEQVHNEEIWIYVKKNQASIQLVNGSPIYTEGHGQVGSLIVSHDITKRKWAEQRLEVSEQRYKSLFEHNPDIVCWIDLRGSVLKVNPALEKLAGHSSESIQGHNIMKFIAVDDLVKAQKRFFLACKGKPQNFEMKAIHRSDSLIDLHVTILPIVVNGQIIGVYAIAKDISNRKRTEIMNHYLAYHDTLTNLPNRRMFQERLQDAIKAADEEASTVAVIFMDLDRFKWINDTLGHSVGDKLLQNISERLLLLQDETDTISRLGGDEFTFIVRRSSARQITGMAQRIFECLTPAFSLEGHDLHITPSIGISLYPQDGVDAETMIRHADLAMYRAKEKGRNNFQFYKPELNEHVHHKMLLESELRKALERGELEIHYQPQISAKNGQLSGMEALIRWKHPELGMISPVDFIPLAEETGLIISIGEWILRSSCLQHMAWKKKGYPPVHIAVNLSASQFQHEGLQEMIVSALKESGMDPNFLELEITESIAMYRFDFVQKKLDALKQVGIQIAIDDFGTGYSSLSYLRKYPIDKLKIDRSFIREMTEREEDYYIVKAVIALAKSLHLTIIAEGVETENQLMMLQQLGCDDIQGYWYSKPKPAWQIEKEFYAAIVIYSIDIDNHSHLL
ncbi:EAL domain-containing protein [Paenibacillus sp. SYP-B3998]|uniref:EAL domain-containing protein n=1 Tax=Paenibacillus sp. SYP-B3998 TaxID=2678564 RepID=A0A6G4A2F6_9BACL|nr:EAL domain-containing protein [Paenibacillus sp. SYP-B3998]NEW08478.1 EAL domain-containing protein [Paenibacillus sp. SYP-B3998]